MSAIGLQGRRTGVVGRPFYLVMALLIAATIAAGFAFTVPGDFGTPGLPLLIHLHGAVFTLWILLFVAQPALIARRSLALHRRLGWIGAALTVAMVVMGIIATVYSVRHDRIPSFFNPPMFVVMNGLGILIFAAVVAAGVALRTEAEWHKRLMLTATIVIMGPGLGRLTASLSQGKASGELMSLVILLFALVGPAADLIVMRRIHPAYYWGVGAVVASLLAPFVGLTPLGPATLALMKGG